MTNETVSKTCPKAGFDDACHRTGLEFHRPAVYAARFGSHRPPILPPARPIPGGEAPQIPGTLPTEAGALRRRGATSDSQYNVELNRKLLGFPR